MPEGLSAYLPVSERQFIAGKRPIQGGKNRISLSGYTPLAQAGAGIGGGKTETISRMTEK
jgi:hypothetical protein